ncbi:MAG TPA: crotonase/enoyl-CoA hydratase family protein [Myxococcota bacterium]|nr:crotonase/enoyl-CoA hydratase family protein [Myxococcota bacterium]
MLPANGESMDPHVHYQLCKGIAEIRMDDGKVNALSLERFEAPGGAEANAMVRAGFELALGILGFPSPVVIACTGHAIAMGVFLVLAGAYRIGALGARRIGANEVAIGIAMPHFGVEICRQRLAPAHFQRAVTLAEMYAPEDAVAAGFLDRVVPAAEVEPAARAVANRLAQLDADVHVASKLRARAQALASIRAAIEPDLSTPLAS